MGVSQKRHRKRHECAGLWANITDEHRREYPGQIAGAEVGRADDQRHQKELGAKEAGVIIVTKRKACQNAGVFQQKTSDETHDEKGDDAAPLVTLCP